MSRQAREQAAASADGHPGDARQLLRSLIEAHYEAAGSAEQADPADPAVVRPSTLRGCGVLEQISLASGDYLLVRRPPAARTGWDALTPREREAVRWVCTGASNKEIAHEMGISASTVGVLLSRAACRLGARGRDDLRCRGHCAAAELEPPGWEP